MLGAGVVSFRIKELFFNRRAIIDRVGEANARNLRRAGGYVRTVAARTVLRRRKRASTPPNPPSIHSRDSVATLRNIQYGSDGKHSVIIGPIGLNGGRRNSQGSVPALLAFGGKGVVIERQLPSGEWLPNSRIPAKLWRGDMPVRRRMGVWQPRPYMTVALKIATDKGKLQNLWANSVK